MITGANCGEPLGHWLRLLWNISPPLQFDSDAPSLEAGVLHMPVTEGWRDSRAASAHMVAHLAYSPPKFDGVGLGPIARALTALLEDARVDSLAVRELPGLARLWRPWHDATPDVGADFEALLRRLARALFDPDYDDPDAWVRKGRVLFLQSTRTPAAIKTIAMRLGHDIGQMRLQFNVKTYQPAPAYRDDSRWMWATDVLHAAPPPGFSNGSRTLDKQDPALANGGSVYRYPEWDYLISRMRPDWCRVTEQPAVPSNSAHAMSENVIWETALRLRAPLRDLASCSILRRRGEEGELFELEALVDWRVARRLRNGAAPPVYRSVASNQGRAVVWLLIDQSASTSFASGNRNNILATSAVTAYAAALALDSVRLPCAIAGFNSEGRHDVRVTMVKSLHEAAGSAVASRLQGLRPTGSTRLGAALRHVTNRLRAARDGVTWIIVLSDGEPHDIDVHDPRYLVDDARHAVSIAARAGVRIVCLLAGAPYAARAKRIFGLKGVQPVADIVDVPRAIRRLFIDAVA